MSQLSDEDWVARFLSGFLRELADGDWQAVSNRFPGWPPERLARLPAACQGTRFLPPADDFLDRADRVQVWTHNDQLGGYLCRVSLLTDGSDQFAADICLTRTPDGDFVATLTGVLDRRG